MPELRIVYRAVDVDPAARDELVERARKAGIWPPGVPTFVFMDRLMVGFDDPEHSGPAIRALIGRDPDFFFETCLTGWGKAALAEFDPAQMQAYRTAWRNPAVIQGSCADYRAALTVDLAHDAADIGRKVGCPALVFWGTKGLMHQLFDMEEVWSQRLSSAQFATLPGGHFFPDQFPEETAARLLTFLEGIA